MFLKVNRVKEKPGLFRLLHALGSITKPVFQSCNTYQAKLQFRINGTIAVLGGGIDRLAGTVLMKE
jgi:hypothetical protein